MVQDILGDIHIVLHRTGEAPVKLQRVHARELTIFSDDGIQQKEDPG